MSTLFVELVNASMYFNCDFDLFFLYKHTIVYRELVK